MSVIFLLGSGISIDAGMPCVAAVSDQVFDGPGVIRHTDATYYIVGNGAIYDRYHPDAEPAIAFAGRLRVRAGTYLGIRSDRPTTTCRTPCSARMPARRTSPRSPHGSQRSARSSRNGSSTGLRHQRHGDAPARGPEAPAPDGFPYPDKAVD